ncbi:hypothetical protein GCM10020295_72910 [Streptomyces cinereospinus]
MHGHSSHHPRPLEVHRDRLILHGCGDFVDDYEGIPGYEEYRDDLRLAYLATLDADTGRLAALRMVPLRARRMRLEHAPARDRMWLCALLGRISPGVRARPSPTGRSRRSGPRGARESWPLRGYSDRMAGIDIRSSAFDDHSFIARHYAYEGENVSPPLAWSGVPDDATELVLLCEDPDAPSGTFAHWIVVGIDPHSDGVAAGQIPPGGTELVNGYGERGWGGPHPRRGTRRTTTTSGSTPCPNRACCPTRRTPGRCTRRWSGGRSPTERWWRCTGAEHGRARGSRAPQVRDGCARPERSRRPAPRRPRPGRCSGSAASGRVRHSSRLRTGGRTGERVHRRLPPGLRPHAAPRPGRGARARSERVAGVLGGRGHPAGGGEGG